VVFFETPAVCYEYDSNISQVGEEEKGRNGEVKRWGGREGRSRERGKGGEGKEWRGEFLYFFFF